MSKQLALGDFSALEQRDAEFVADSELWDNRLLGADEDHVKVCSDRELVQIINSIISVLPENQKSITVYSGADAAKYQREHSSIPTSRSLARQLTQGSLEENKKVVVLGAGPKRVGGAVGVLMALAQSRAVLFDTETWAVEEEKLPMFDKDYNQVKLRKGRGHNKLNKGKRK